MISLVGLHHRCHLSGTFTHLITLTLFAKDMILIGAALVVFTGARVIDEGEVDAEELLFKTESLIWGGILLVIHAVTFVYQFLLGCTKSSCLTQNINFVMLLLGETVAGVFIGEFIHCSNISSQLFAKSNCFKSPSYM